jgi:hypothetical protein
MQITTISEVTPQRIEQMAIDYIRTMSWNYLYYCQGTDAVNHDWSYPYYHTPLLVDLAAVMQAVDVNLTITGFESYEGMTPFTALHQLVAVLPLKSKDLLPTELQPLFTYNSIIRDFFPESFIIEMDGKNKEHEGVPIVPLIDRRRVIDAVAQITFDPQRALLWLPPPPGSDRYIRTEEETEYLAHLQADRERHQAYLARQTQQRERGRGRGGFHQQRDRFQQQRGGFQQQRGGFQQQRGGFQQQRGGFRQQRGGFQQQRGGFQQQEGGFRQQRGGFQQQEGGFRQQRGGFQQTAKSPRVQQTYITPAKSPIRAGTREATRGGRGRGRAETLEIRRPPTTIQLPQAITLPMLTETNVVQLPPLTETPMTEQAVPQRGPAQLVRPGPPLVPIGMTLPEGLNVGKATFAPAPQIQVTPARQATTPQNQVTPVRQTTTPQPRSPAQWKELPTLM